MVQCFCASDGPVSSIRLGKLPATRPPMVGKTVNGWFKRNVQLWYQSNLMQDRIIFRHVSPPVNVKLSRHFVHGDGSKVSPPNYPNRMGSQNFRVSPIITRLPQAVVFFLLVVLVLLLRLFQGTREPHLPSMSLGRSSRA